MVDDEVERLDRALVKRGEVAPERRDEPLNGLLRAAGELTQVLSRATLTPADRARIHARAQLLAAQPSHRGWVRVDRGAVLTGGALAAFGLGAVVGAVALRQQSRRSRARGAGRRLATPAT